MKSFVILSLSLIILFPFTHANGYPGDAELVLHNLEIFPQYPQEGELVRITAEVHNGGITSTNSIASIITAAYFVDDELLQILEIGNVEPGLRNKIPISSDLIWNAEPGIHKIKIILDYHDTLNDKYDFPDGNTLEKSFTIRNLESSKMELTSSPPYVTPNAPVLVTATVSLTDLDSSSPLDDRKILLVVDDVDIPLTTNIDGFASFSKMIDSQDDVKVQSFFEGDSTYRPANSSLTIHSIPDEIDSAMILNVADIEKKFSFDEYSFEFLVFQDSYDKLIQKVTSDSAISISDAFLIPLLPGHDYFAEVYLDGRFFFLTEKKHLQENSAIVENLRPLQSAEIRFKVIDELGTPQNNVVVDNWIYSVTTSDDGFTEWIEVLPAPSHMPYVAEVILSNGTVVQSVPFVIFPDERKTIQLDISQNHPSSYDVPNWIQTNAGWWADGQIDDESFLESIYSLVEEDILSAPSNPDDNHPSSYDVPNWIQTNAGWWADGQIDDESFLAAMQFLIDKEILKFE